MGNDNLLPEQKARIIIDRQLNEAGWEVVNRDEYIPQKPQAVREALTKGGKESDYMLFVDGKAIAVVEAKKAEDNLGDEVESQAEDYANNPKKMYGLWIEKKIPLVYLANSKKIMFKNLLDENSDYIEIEKFHSPKKMLKIIKMQSEYGSLPLLEKEGLRDCQYDAELAFEKSLINRKNKGLAVLTTGAGKTYLACLASYRLLNYTPIDRILFLVDRNNLAKQTEGEFSKFDRTENKIMLNSLYSIKRLRRNEDIDGDIVISTIQKLFSVLTGKRLIDGEYVLVGEDGAPFLDSTSTKAYIINGKSWVNNHAHVLKSKTNNKFLMYYLNWFNYFNYVSGTTRLKLNQAMLRKIPFPNMPLEIKEQIVKKIEKAYKILESIN